VKTAWRYSGTTELQFIIFPLFALPSFACDETLEPLSPNPLIVAFSVRQKQQDNNNWCIVNSKFNSYISTKNINDAIIRHSGVQPETWDTSSLQLCGQQTVLTLTQSTTRFGGSYRSVCTAAWFLTSTRSKSGNFSTRWSSIKRSGSSVHVFELAFDFEHTVDILNTDFRCAEDLPFARTHTWQ